MEILDRIIDRARAAPGRIVLCEGEDPRILQAGVRAARAGIARITLVGARDRIEAAAAGLALDLSALALVDPQDCALTDGFAAELLALRQAKGMTAGQAQQAVLDPLCFADLMVRLGHADGCVAGAVRTTADVVRTAIQVVGVDRRFKLVSSFFLMVLCHPFHAVKGGLIFSDCGLVVDPDARELSEIAMAAADSARSLLDEEPRVAMLSFSTGGSARHAAVDKVVQATQLVRQQRPALVIHGEMQLDAALVPAIAQRKVVNHTAEDPVNVLVFPNLDAGNIGYKLAERIGGAVAIGPLLQGLHKPVNDLSRGCSADDVFHVIAVTVLQAQAAMQPDLALARPDPTSAHARAARQPREPSTNRA